MSYILDALRKADAERERGSVPDLKAQLLPPMVADEEVTEGGARRWLWPGAAAAIVAVAAIGWWLWPGDAPSPVARPAAPPPAPAPRAPAERLAGPLAERRAASVPAPDGGAARARAEEVGPGGSSAGPPAPTVPTPAPAAPRSPRTPSRPSPDPVVAAAPAGVAPQAAASTAAAAAPASPVAAARAPAAPTPAPAAAPATAGPLAAVRGAAPATAAMPAAGPATAASTPVAVATAAALLNAPGVGPAPMAAAAENRPARVPTLTELPADLRQQVPTLAMGGSVYSPQPSARMVIVNGQVFQEGAMLGPDLQLEQIRPKSAVFSIRGQRFEVPL